MISTWTPLLWAFTKAFAIGADVNEYAWISISDFALSICSIIAFVQPPLGEKQTLVTSTLNAKRKLALFH